MKTTIQSFTKSLLIPFIAGAVLAIQSASIQAAPIISEAFDSPTATLPSDWTTPGDSAVVGISTFNGLNQLRFTRPTSMNLQNQVIYYSGTGIDHSLPESKIADFEASVIINTGNLVQRKATTSATGMVIKATSATSYGLSSGSYFIGFSPAADPESATWKPGLGIWTDQPYDPPTQYGNKAQHTDALAFDVFDPFSIDTEVLLKVVSDGTSLTASLWALSDTGEVAEMLASVNLDSASTTAGYVGLRAAYGNTGVNTYFRDFQVTSIPEPKSAFLFSAVGLLCIGAMAVKRSARNRESVIDVK